MGRLQDFPPHTICFFGSRDGDRATASPYLGSGNDPDICAQARRNICRVLVESELCWSKFGVILSNTNRDGDRRKLKMLGLIQIDSKQAFCGQLD